MWIFFSSSKHLFYPGKDGRRLLERLIILKQIEQ